MDNLKSKSKTCCSEAGENQLVQLKNEAAEQTVRQTSDDWHFSDYAGAVKCRISGLRMRYSINPGLYSVGIPDRKSDVFVSANYKLSFDILRRELKGLNAWILVLDTKGINVWCAAGKGTFGTDELIRRISIVQLEKLVLHKRIIVPQLGAPGISAHKVQQETGFRVYYGPVRAGDIRDYLEAGYRTTKEMRTVRFPFMDRLVLTPMEIIPAMRLYMVYALLILLITGIQPSGIVFKHALTEGFPFLFLGLISVLTGALVTPLFLPLIPFRSFAIKGWITGMILTILSVKIIGIHPQSQANTTFIIFTYLFFPLVSSYIALQFTGSTTFTGMSGVRKELKFALPVYIAAACISLILLTFYKLGQIGII